MVIIFLAIFFFFIIIGFYGLTHFHYYYVLNQFLIKSTQINDGDKDECEIFGIGGYAIPEVVFSTPTIVRRSTRIPSYKHCPKCGKGLRLINGKYGQFLGCTGYPECNYTQNIK